MTPQAAPVPAPAGLLRHTAVDPAEILHPEVALDPAPFFARLRAYEPVHWNEPTRSWYVTRHADVEALLMESALGARDKTEMLAGMTEDMRAAFAPVERFLGKWLVFADPPYQLKARKALQRAFTPRSLEPFTETIRAHAEAAVGALSPGEQDLFRQVARPYALTAVCAFLGILDEEQEDVLRWSDALIGYLSMPVLAKDVALAAGSAVRDLTRYVTGTVLPRGAGPMAALLGSLYADGSLDDEEVTALFAQLLTGGAEPVSTAIAVGMSRLLADPAQHAALRDGVVPYAAAVEEAVRHASPFHFAPRTALRDFTYHGHHITKGQRVVLVLAAANRDPEVFTDPDRFDIRRTGGRHVAFGRGGHFCLGAALARMEIEVLFRALDRRHPGLRPGSTPFVREPAFGVTSVSAIPCLV
ncbi:cytochrome P450 [Kitasatospora sp. NPDC056138]|uniref:cytochrome P450 n=1 Tax=Kitasatospora sp. NPDC056138 TaxID=3345724 RepID=UPI0035D90D50